VLQPQVHPLKQRLLNGVSAGRLDVLRVQREWSLLGFSSMFYELGLSRVPAIHHKRLAC
jgi:hypothetical protein